MEGKHSSDVISRELVRWGYKLLLGRDPESEAAITGHLRAPDRHSLVRRFLESAEFRSACPDFVPRQLNRLEFPMSVEVDVRNEQLLALTARVAGTWRNLGEARPHWSVLSDDKFLPQNIQATKESFYESGARDVTQLLSVLKHIGRRPEEFQSVMEFGCGLGRITNHLSKYFRSVIGCDISESHLALARCYSSEIGAKGITYREITAPDFGMNEPIDLWYSVIVLQHNPPPVMASILRRSLQMLRPGGIVVFQVPTYGPGYTFIVDDYLNLPMGESFDMHILPQSNILRIAKEAECTVLEILEDSRAGPNWLSNLFIIGR